MIDLYCEVLGPGLWAEPLNALTNLAFLLTALASWQLARRSESGDGSLGSRITLMVAIGAGSALSRRWRRVGSESSTWCGYCCSSFGCCGYTSCGCRRASSVLSGAREWISPRAPSRA